MSVFASPDLVPLWDRPPDFLPLRPPGGAHHWRYRTVRRELQAASEELHAEGSERRVALLAHPGLGDGTTTEGLHAGIQLLLPGESSDPHRHTPAALRVGLEGRGIVTTVNDEELGLDPLDVVLNPSGTWHGHEDRAGAGGAWLDIVDLPLVSALGAVLFEPAVALSDGPLLDPPLDPPATVRYPWAEAEAELAATPPVDGVASVRYGGGAVLPTLAVTAYSVDDGATLGLPARTAGTVALIGRGRFDLDGTELAAPDIVALRSWTPASFTSGSADGLVLTIDTSPVTKQLGLYRQRSAS